MPFAVVVRRYPRATGTDRVRMRWLLWAAVVDVLVMLSLLVFPQGWTDVALPVAVGLTGAAVAGIARPGLLDIDRLLGGTLLYGGLAIAVVLVDLAVVGGTTALLGRRDVVLLALTVVLVFYAPLRDRLWRVIRRFALGRRDDPYGVVAGLAEQLERSDEP
ncbi:hypothetical protein [Cryptosporangium aurantiacum]|uniref:Uncharacterized protein n=1 Tax=Cryptosporangium aurantiacum TaxID=134849 RepID=A0A1M7RKU4_9ACTN|nr:hypothetical protein [Cryptosporangium aurantiacum]SHN46927.1 hypothetical protein SAMN05443668_11923 [Cryptosporangium aurantiacum]